MLRPTVALTMRKINVIKKEYVVTEHRRYFVIARIRGMCDCSGLMLKTNQNKFRDHDQMRVFR
jgi:hypothetical protein